MNFNRFSNPLHDEPDESFYERQEMAAEDKFDIERQEAALNKMPEPFLTVRVINQP